MATRKSQIPKPTRRKGYVDWRQHLAMNNLVICCLLMIMLTRTASDEEVTIAAQGVYKEDSSTTDDHKYTVGEKSTRSGKMKFLVFLSLVTLAACTAKYEFLEEWNLWKNEHGKSYGSEKEDLGRHLIWLSNKKYIEQHNANSDIFGFTLAMNHLGDLTDAEYHQLYLTYNPGNYTNSKAFHPDPYRGYPDSIDWRTKGAVTSVKNQGQCGASYAFSAMGALEGAWALANGKSVTLSEQNVIDCSVTYGNHGCHGGNMYNTFWYVVSNEGVDTTSSYPYQGKQTSCMFDNNNVGAEMSGTVQIKSGSETYLKAAVATAGPVSVAVDSSSNAFRFYQYGVYDSSTCSSSSVNHATLITGYGTSSSKDYWLVKNSWGTNWGMSGYIMMARNKYNQCGIASDASYPSL